MALCEHCGVEYSAWDDEEYVFHNDTTGNVPHCVGIKDARLDSARVLLNWIAQESISFDESNSGRQIGNPGLRGLLIEPGDITHRRIDTWLAEDGEE